jgi:hypothetical protein
MPSPEFVFGLMGFGADPSERDVTRGALADMYGELFMEVFHAVARSLDTRVDTLTPEHRTVVAPADLRVRAGTIPGGTVAATEWRWRARFASGTEMLHSVTWTADPSLHGAHGREAAAWRIEIGGRPNVRAAIAIEDPDPAAPHMRAAVDAVVALAVQAIPAVCSSPPGFYVAPEHSAFRARLA